MNNRNTREAFLMHWGFKKGEEAKSHKYIAREDTGKLNKRGNSIYRYFYTKESYDAYKRGLTGAHTNGYKDKLKEFKLGISQKFDALIRKGKILVDRLLTSFGMEPYFGIEKKELTDAMKAEIAKENEKEREKLKRYTIEDPEADEIEVKEDSETDEDTTKDRGKKKGVTNKTYKTKSGIEVTENASGSEKYIAKIRFTNGKTRYFYDETSYNRWKKTQEYQENEPSYMQKLKENDISPEGKIPSDDENMILTNDPNGGPNRTVNCIYCSLTYELRSRGYDVEAVDKKSIHTPVAAFNSWYKLPHKVGNVAEPIFDYSAYPPTWDFKQNDHVTTIRKKDTTTYDELVQLVDKSFPDGSRGTISVEWEHGGGHAYNFEKTEQGKVVFRDGQVDLLHDEKSMQYHIAAIKNDSPIVLLRTDDLIIKEEALDYVQERNGPDEWYDSNRIK